MKTSFLALTAALTLASLSAQANPFTSIKKNQPLCYEREYSSEHMAKNSKQTVKSIKIKIHRGIEEYDSDQLYLAIEADVKPKGKKDYKHYRTGMACREESGKLHCFIDCDGGSATLRPSLEAPQNWMRLENNGFVMYGGCGEDVDENDTVRIEPTKGGDNLFMLKKMEDAKACAAVKGF